MATSNYQRLTRARINQHFAVITATRVSLWLGSDHLLHVENNGFTEIYKRFYFRDIQAFTVLESRRRGIWNAILLVPVAICLVGVMACAFPVRNAAAMFVWALFAALFLVPFAINTIRGPTCNCQLRTAVQTEDLGSLSRVRQTHKVLEKIRPLIAAAQGQLTAEEVAARMQEAAAGINPGRQPEPPAEPPIAS